MNDVSEKSILIKKIRHILKSDTASSAFLEKLETEDLSTLNDQIQDALFSDQSEHWKRVAKVVKFFPNYMNAKVSEQVLGAYITANVCYHIETKDLIGISKHLSIPFLAEVTENIIPAKSHRVVNEMPVPVIQKVIEYLMKKEQHFVVASFIEVVERKRLMQLIDSIPQESDLLKSSEFIRNPELLKDIFLSFSVSRQTKMLQTAVKIKKEGVIIKTLQQMGERDRNNIINIFLKTNPQGAAAFVEGING